MENNKVVFAISKLNGGGAEHVMIQLADFFSENGFYVELLVTNQKRENAVLNGLADGIKCSFAEDEFAVSPKRTLSARLASLECRICEKCGRKIPDKAAEKAFMNMYGRHVAYVREHMRSHADSTYIAFLQPTNHIVMKASEECGVKVIVSERCDPIRYFRSRYAPLFLKKYYPLLAGMVFQTPNARDCYPENIRNIGTVIPNPVPSTLPLPHDGERKKKIVNFCRLSRQKNLPMLVDAFEIFSRSHPDYSLEIIGSGEERDSILAYISKKECAGKISVLPHKENLHSSIADYAMFVSTSDFEGISNSMLEAMAIGLPTVCTDCPIGGAAFMIEDHENGLLVPVGDAEKAAAAMAEIADDPSLSSRLSSNSRLIREKYSLAEIGKRWIEYVSSVSHAGERMKND